MVVLTWGVFYTDSRTGCNLYLILWTSLGMLDLSLDL